MPYSTYFSDVCLCKKENEQEYEQSVSQCLSVVCVWLPGWYLLLFNNVQTHCSAEMRQVSSFPSVTLTVKPALGNAT